MISEENFVHDCLRSFLGHPLTNFSLIKNELLTNKVLKCFISNDGSMTKMLLCLFDDLKLELNYEGLVISQELLNYSTKVTGQKIECDLVERRISFWSKETKIMTGVSFWDKNFYEDLYPDEKLKKIPIGVMIQQKQIEFFRELKYFLVEYDDNKAAMRFSFYKNKGRVVFLLFEMFESLKILESKLGHDEC